MIAKRPKSQVAIIFDYLKFSFHIVVIPGPSPASTANPAQPSSGEKKRKQFIGIQSLPALVSGSGYLPPALPSGSGYLPPSLPSGSGYLPPALPSGSGYLPPALPSGSGYLPTVE